MPASEGQHGPGLCRDKDLKSPFRNHACKETDLFSWTEEAFSGHSSSNVSAVGIRLAVGWWCGEL